MSRDGPLATAAPPLAAPGRAREGGAVVCEQNRERELPNGGGAGWGGGNRLTHFQSEPLFRFVILSCSSPASASNRSYELNVSAYVNDGAFYDSVTEFQ